MTQPGYKRSWQAWQEMDCLIIQKMEFGCPKRAIRKQACCHSIPCPLPSGAILLKQIFSYDYSQARI
jgi:hypothetical protein